MKKSLMILIAAVIAASFTDALAQQTSSGSRFEDGIYTRPGSRGKKTKTSETINEEADRQKEELDALIARYSTSRELARIARVDLCILRVALYEMKYSHEVAESIAINEAVELAKRFSEPASARFVNGMLGAISRGEQPEGKKDQPASKPEQKADEDGEKQDS